MTQSYVTRENWPLYQRVDDIIQQMAQAGLILKARADFIDEVKRERHRKAAKKKSFKVMVPKQLAFSFYFLIIGYTCATIVFILELVVGRSIFKPENQMKKSMKRNKKMQINDKITKILTWN